MAAWPCTPGGAFAHEAAHGLGLPHPEEVPERADVAFHSLMQTHWDYPRFAPPVDRPWGFLSLERVDLLANPFMRQGIDLQQIYPDCDVVNLPDNGPLPTAGFDLAVDGLTVTATNTSSGAILDYWTFGDGSVSNQVSPRRSYAQGGSYQLSLRVMSELGMIDRVSTVADLSPLPRLVAVEPGGSGSGLVRSAPAGIRCGSEYLDGTTVRLSAEPDLGSEFLGFGGDPDCADGSLSVYSDTTCAALFEPCSIDSVVNLPPQEVAAEEVFEACNHLTAGSGGFRNLATGLALLRAGNSIELENGLLVENDGGLTLAVGPPTP